MHGYILYRSSVKSRLSCLAGSARAAKGRFELALRCYSSVACSVLADRVRTITRTHTRLRKSGGMVAASVRSCFLNAKTGRGDWELSSAGVRIGTRSEYLELPELSGRDSSTEEGCRKQVQPWSEQGNTSWRSTSARWTRQSSSMVECRTAPREGPATENPLTRRAVGDRAILLRMLNPERGAGSWSGSRRRVTRPSRS